MSYAIIRTGGKQFRVEPGMTLRLPTLVGDAGASIEFNDVLLGSDGNTVHTGVPSISGAKVTGEIVKRAEAKGCTLAELSLAELQAVEPAITMAVYDVLAVEHSVASRTSLGGTAPVRVREAAAAARSRFL